MGISKGTFYYSNDPSINFEQKYNRIKEFVKKIVEKRPSYGIRRIKEELDREYGVFVGRDALGKLLKIWGLALKRSIKKKKRSLIEEILILLSDRANLLVRQLSSINKPLMAITSDISDFKFNFGKEQLSVCVHKDVFGQQVYGYAIGKTKDKQLVLNSFKMASNNISLLIKKFNIKRPLLGVFQKIIVHQDQGTQYTCYDYIQTVLKTGLFRLSFSKKGTPTDNAGQESFFGRFKDENKEVIYEIKSYEEAKRFVEKRIYYYNTERFVKTPR